MISLFIVSNCLIYSCLSCLFLFINNLLLCFSKAVQTTSFQECGGFPFSYILKRTLGDQYLVSTSGLCLGLDGFTGNIQTGTVSENWTTVDVNLCPETIEENRWNYTLAGAMVITLLRCFCKRNQIWCINVAALLLISVLNIVTCLALWQCMCKQVPRFLYLKNEGSDYYKYDNITKDTTNVVSLSAELLILGRTCNETLFMIQRRVV